MNKRIIKSTMKIVHAWKFTQGERKEACDAILNVCSFNDKYRYAY
jgi:hypothetical protein